MADTVPEINPTDVLPASRQKIENPIFAAGATGDTKEAQDRLTASIEKTNKINEAREKDPAHLKTTLEAAAAPPDFSNSQMEEIATALGENIATTNTITNELQPLAQYLEAVRKAKLSGKEIKDVLPKGFDTKKVAEILINRGRLMEKFSDLKAFERPADKDALNTFIEQALARDPRFQSAMAEVLNEIHKDAKVISSEAENPETKKLKDDKDIFEKRKTAQADVIRQALRGMHLENDAIEELVKSVDAGVSNKSILLQAEHELVKVNGIEDRYSQLNDYAVALSRVDQANADLRQKREELDRLGVGKNRDGQRADVLMKEIARLEIDLPSFKGQSDALKTNIVSATYPEADFSRDFLTLNRIKGLVKDESALTSNINDYRENAQRVTELETQITSIEPKKTAAELAGAEKTKADLLKRLEASVDTAMSNFLTLKYNNYESDQRILTNAAIKEAEESGKDWKANTLREISLKMDKWSDFKDGKYTRNSDEIAKSLKTAAEYSARGEDGVRQIMAEQAGIRPNKNVLRDQIATEIIGPSAKYDTLSDANKQRVDAFLPKRTEDFLKDKVANEVSTGTKYDALSETDKAKADKIIEQRNADFEEIFTEQGDNFKKRLFVEYNAARGFMDKAGRGSLSLSNDEIQILNKQFGGFMEKELEKSGVMKALKEKGIYPDSKMKWALMILILLGVGVAAATVAPAVVAAGAAATGAGSGIVS